MKQGGSYLQFVERPTEANRKTKIFSVRNTACQVLGNVCFKPAWRKYVFVTTFDQSEFDASCLGEIASFLITITNEWRQSL